MTRYTLHVLQFIFNHLLCVFTMASQISVIFRATNFYLQDTSENIFFFNRPLRNISLLCNLHCQHIVTCSYPHRCSLATVPRIKGLLLYNVFHIVIVYMRLLIDRTLYHVTFSWLTTMVLFIVFSFMFSLIPPNLYSIVSTFVICLTLTFSPPDHLQSLATIYRNYVYHCLSTHARVNFV